ncbi:MAG: DUF3352 domain-containing protein [Bacteroidia bacterium]|nr:DUF3352 domain-containing protein [Bacteroidia bacterium]
MGKIVRNILLLLLALIIISGSVIGYFYYNKEEIVVTQLLKAVPTDAAIVVECKNATTFFNHLQTKSNVWNLLIQVTEINEINSKVSWLDSLFINSKELAAVSAKGPLIVSVHLSGKKRYETLFLMNFGSFITEEKIKTFLKTEFGDSIRINERNYNETIMYETILPDESKIKNFSWAISQGVFVFSESSLLVEDAIRQVQSDYSLLDKPGFRKVLETAGKNVDGNIYVNHKAFPGLVSVQLANCYQKSVSASTNIAEWSEIDFHVKPDMFMFNGFTYPGDSIANYTNIFMNQEPQKFSTSEVMPGDVYSYLFLGISDFKKYMTDYKNYLEAGGKINTYNKDIDFIKKSYKIDIEAAFGSIIDGEVVMAFADNQLNANDSVKSEYVFIKTKSRSLTEEGMNLLINRIAQVQNRKPESYQSQCVIDAETSFPVYSFPIKNIGGLLFGNVFDRVPTSYFTYLDNYLVFSSSKLALKKLHHSYLLKKTLANDGFYQSYTENLDSKSNFLFYIDLSRAKDFASGFLNKELSQIFNANFEVFKRLDAISCQMNVSRGMIYNSIIIKYNPEIKEKTHTIWESRLDSTISQKPYFLINHLTDEKEVFVQDDGRTLYLINSTGRILWKNNITETILSDVFQVDAFKNKKLQYLFNTRNYIYLIDRNGDYLERFPIKLQSPATNGISIVDFDGKGNIRIFVACSDKKIYCYTPDGNIVKDWKFEQTDNFVYQPIQFFKVKDKNYVVFADTLNCYLLDRKGKEVIKLKEYFPINRKSRFFYEQKNPETEDRLVTTTVDGGIRYIYFDGTVKKQNIGNFTQNHFFDYHDMDGDGYCEFIYLDQDELSIYNRLKKKTCSYDFSETPLFRPVYYEFPGARHKIGIVCKENNKIYLIDKDGKLPKGFPLDGGTPFSISHFSTNERMYNLIVGNKDGFLYNYEVY